MVRIADLAGVAYLPAEVYTRRPVDDVAYNGGVQLVLGIVHVGGLRLQVGAEVQAECFAAHKAEHDACVLVVLLVGGVLAVLHVADVVESPNTRHAASLPMNSSPMINAWASPSGEGCSAYEMFTPKSLPSPRSL